ncbi:hypothetical protein PH562_20405 [Rhizobium sp. CNPSo 4062]|uniref:hypothetical protein n=1 Tax=Rhizobium sp. CNPSo 4062 TaxID=3021410 RepID=UPI00254D004A|nr:hypothetical protein [Rhizobium sp. CNPSo 4062]MDK4704627.1 hypothetical protein [Rhizobium sp. CNPSo 4062]
MPNDSPEIPEIHPATSAWLLATDEQGAEYMHSEVADVAKFSWDMRAWIRLAVDFILKNKEKDGANYQQ